MFTIRNRSVILHIHHSLTPDESQENVPSKTNTFSQGDKTIQNTKPLCVTEFVNKSLSEHNQNIAGS